MASRALAVAYGYDLLYDAMTDGQRAQCREALRKNVFAPYMEAHALYNPELRAFTDHEGHWEWWTTCYFNWNSWVNGGIGLAALAMLDEVPEAPKVVEMARASLKCVTPEWDQGDIEDGGWDEGPMYWGAAALARGALLRRAGTRAGHRRRLLRAARRQEDHAVRHRLLRAGRQVGQLRRLPGPPHHRPAQRTLLPGLAL